jgi:hypothetical protein
MSRLMIVGLAMLATSGPVTAQTLWDVEHARMSALAGGPTNEWDAWLLERYGCYSGTRSHFCESLARRRITHRARPPSGHQHSR